MIISSKQQHWAPSRSLNVLSCSQNITGHVQTLVKKQNIYVGLWSLWKYKEALLWSEELLLFQEHRFAGFGSSQTSMFQLRPKDLICFFHLWINRWSSKSLLSQVTNPCTADEGPGNRCQTAASCRATGQREVIFIENIISKWACPRAIHIGSNEQGLSSWHLASGGKKSVCSPPLLAWGTSKESSAPQQSHTRSGVCNSCSSSTRCRPQGSTRGRCTEKSVSLLFSSEWQLWGLMLSISPLHSSWKTDSYATCPLLQAESNSCLLHRHFSFPEGQRTDQFYNPRFALRTSTRHFSAHARSES